MKVLCECQHCGGSGEVVLNNTNPYGYGPDPQYDEAVKCMWCDGDGDILVEVEDKE